MLFSLKGLLWTAQDHPRRMIMESDRQCQFSATLLAGCITSRAPPTDHEISTFRKLKKF
jgi:hypothetical protein